MISVAISRFEGPFDLLLALVRRNQYPLAALPIAEITRQYLSYIKEAREADVELGGDFLETASWLVLHKSRALLPQAAGEAAPVLELERALLDHGTLLRTAGLLRSRIDAAGVGPGVSEPDSPMRTVETVTGLPTVQDALLAARRALAVAQAHAQGSRELESESYPVAAVLVRLDRRIEALEPGRGVSTEVGSLSCRCPKPRSLCSWRCWSWRGCRESFSGRGKGLALSCSSESERDQGDRCSTQRD